MSKEKADKFIEWVGNNYDELQYRYKKFCSNTRITYDDDVFSDTIVKCFNLIEKNGINDDTPKGYDDYLFKAFKNNIKREKQYSRVAKKKEIPDVPTAYEDYYNNYNDSPTKKIMRDLKEDFSALYVIKKVEEQFPPEYVYVFKLKFLYKLTYKELQKKSNVKNSRQKVIDVIHWLKENLTKQEVEKAFEDFKGEIL